LRGLKVANRPRFLPEGVSLGAARRGLCPRRWLLPCFVFSCVFLFGFVCFWVYCYCRGVPVLRRAGWAFGVAAWGLPWFLLLCRLCRVRLARGRFICRWFPCLRFSSAVRGSCRPARRRSRRGSLRRWRRGARRSRSGALLAPMPLFSPAWWRPARRPSASCFAPLVRAASVRRVRSPRSPVSRRRRRRGFGCASGRGAARRFRFALGSCAVPVRRRVRRRSPGGCAVRSSAPLLRRVRWRRVRLRRRRVRRLWRSLFGAARSLPVCPVRFLLRSCRGWRGRGLLPASPGRGAGVGFLRSLLCFSPLRGGLAPPAFFLCVFVWFCVFLGILFTGRRVSSATAPRKVTFRYGTNRPISFIYRRACRHR